MTIKFGPAMDKNTLNCLHLVYNSDDMLLKEYICVYPNVCTYAYMKNGDVYTFNSYFLGNKILIDASVAVSFGVILLHI